jgi:site-specific DNA-methyltransferase (adenine-specific)
MKLNVIYNQDCIEGFKKIESQSIDVILCDLPYGVTQNKADVSLSLDVVWKNYRRIIKESGVILLTAQFPFTLHLLNTCKVRFRYDLIWDKVLISGFLNAKRMPLRKHEHILVFYKKLPVYNPQFLEGKPLHSKGVSYITKEHTNNNYGKFKMTDDKRAGSTKKYPTSIITISKSHPSIAEHPTEKPVELGEYLIKTYSNEGFTVLDNTCGTGNFLLAAKNLNRNYIGFEINKDYLKKCEKKELNIEWNIG